MHPITFPAYEWCPCSGPPSQTHGFHSIFSSSKGQIVIYLALVRKRRCREQASGRSVRTVDHNYISEIAHCLADAIANDEHYGVWGGVDALARTRLAVVAA